MPAAIYRSADGNQIWCIDCSGWEFVWHFSFIYFFGMRLTSPNIKLVIMLSIKMLKGWNTYIPKLHIHLLWTPYLSWLMRCPYFEIFSPWIQGENIMKLGWGYVSWLTKVSGCPLLYMLIGNTRRLQSLIATTLIWSTVAWRDTTFNWHVYLLHRYSQPPDCLSCMR